MGTNADFIRSNKKTGSAYRDGKCCQYKFDHYVQGQMEN